MPEIPLLFQDEWIKKWVSYIICVTVREGNVGLMDICSIKMPRYLCLL